MTGVTQAVGVGLPGADELGTGEGSRDLVSLVIPVTTHGVQTRELVEAYAAVLRAAGVAHEFVFVLDGLRGRVEEDLLDLASRHPIQIVRLQGGGLGESIALSAGVARARGEFIVNAPEYLQSEPADIVQVIQALHAGADFVATWRHHRVDPWLNRLQSRFFNWILRRLMGVRFHDLNSSVRGMRRQVLDDVNVYGEMYRFLPVLAQRQGFRVVEVKVRHREEQGRTGFYGVGVYVRRLLDILAISFLTRFTQKPLRFFGALGMLLMVLGVALCVDPLWSKFVHGDTLTNKPILVLGCVLFAFGVQLIAFGLVGEIIIFTQARNLRDYKVDEFDPEVEDGEAGDGEPLRPAAAASAPLAGVVVRELFPGEDARWDAFVRGHPGGTFFHRSGWRKVIEDTFHHRPRYLVAEQGGRWRGVLPLIDIRSPFLGRNLVSTAYAVYGGPLGDGPETTAALVRHAIGLGNELSARYVELRQLDPLDDVDGVPMARSALYVTFRKELPADPDEVMPAIPKRARAEVRRARDRFDLQFAADGGLEDFCRLFQHNKRRLGSPAMPSRWFRALVDEFGDRVVIHEVRLPDGTVIASVMSFVHGDTLYAYYSGASHRHYKTGVNDFVYCRIMEWAARAGLRRFDFGRSRVDTGPAAFKKNMGFEAQPLPYVYALLHSDARLPEFHPSNPRLALPRRLWARLPRPLAAALGGRLTRYIP